jgi:hypothetical protein
MRSEGGRTSVENSCDIPIVPMSLGARPLRVPESYWRANVAHKQQAFKINLAPPLPHEMQRSAVEPGLLGETDLKS